MSTVNTTTIVTIHQNLLVKRMSADVFFTAVVTKKDSACAFT